jgi:hypothetical protein
MLTLLQLSPKCHSERSEESLITSKEQSEMFRSAQHDSAIEVSSIADLKERARARAEVTARLRRRKTSSLETSSTSI